MATLKHVHSGSASDYGSELDTDGEETVNALLVALDGNPISNLAVENLVEEDARPTCLAHVPKSSQASATSAHAALPLQDHTLEIASLPSPAAAEVIIAGDTEASDDSCMAQYSMKRIRLTADSV